MPEEATTPPSQTITVALFVDAETFDRFGRILRHLIVGLVDQAIVPRVLSDDPRVDSLTLGPVQTVRYQRVVWPVRRGRLSQIVDVLSHQPPTLVHALSAGTYGIALEVATALDTELVVQVSSLGDFEALTQWDLEPGGRFVAMTEPLRAMLVGQLNIPAERVMLVRPGVPVSEQTACFGKTGCEPTILCTTDFERHGGIETLVAALDLARKQIAPPATFLLGQGRGETGLRRLVREKKLSSAITFAQPLGNPIGVIQSADLFIRPRADTAVSGDVLHAMGAGSLVITFDSPLLDYIQADRTAVVCKAHTAQALADAIVSAIRNPEQSRAIALSGLEYVRANHGVSAMAEQTATAYRELALTGTTFAIHR